MKNEEIQIRDPFVLLVDSEKKYYLYGSTDKNIWGNGTGFDVYVGTDLENWEGPYPVFRPDENFWADKNFWAPEVHEYKGIYYMFATFKKDGLCRGTQILTADSPLGPFVPYSDGPVTPKDWECLDGTLFIDNDGSPWIIFCHEWVQVRDGEVCALRLSEDLKTPIGEPVILFRASEAPWVHYYDDGSESTKTNFVTDGPFIYKSPKGEITLLWSSFLEDNVYAIGTARSSSGKISGPWVHDKKPMCSNDAGHGMVFRTIDNHLVLTIHSPNQTPYERPMFIEVIEENETLKI